jgi:hypothetical protein
VVVNHLGIGVGLSNALQKLNKKKKIRKLESNLILKFSKDDENLQNKK